MKKFLLFSSLLFIGLTFASCGDDDDPVDPLLGEWQIDNYEIINVPSDFDRIEGPQDIVYAQETRYRITFNADFTYEREVRASNSIFSEDGEWERDGDELILDPDSNQGFVNDFQIEEQTVESLILSGKIQFPLFPNNVVTDTISSQESFDALFEEFGQVLDLDVLHNFEKR